MPTENLASPRAVCAAMNRLIRACEDGAVAQAEAATERLYARALLVRFLR
jgi:hypothetical protein